MYDSFSNENGGNSNQTLENTSGGGSGSTRVYGYNLESTYLTLIIIIHVLIILIAIVGNSIVIYLVVFNDKLRNVRNAFMVNLTLSNLLLATVCTPWFLVTLVYPRLTLSETWCKLSNSIPIVIILVSAFSIMMISIDRWMFVVFARSRQFKSKEASIIIVLIWFFAILLATPMYYNRHTKSQMEESIRQQIYNALKNSKFSKETPELVDILNVEDNPESGVDIDFAVTKLSTSSFNENVEVFSYSEINYSLPVIEDTKYCVEDWVNPEYKRVYILILFCLEFVLPLLCMLITYIWIVRFLKVQNDRMSHYEMLRKKLIQKDKPHQKNCKLLSALCLAFIVCCLPLSLFNIVTDFVSTSPDKQTVIYWPLTILTTMELMNTVLSPLLYGYMNHNFRMEINDNLKRIKLRYARQNSTVRNNIELVKLPLKCYNSD